MLKSVNLRWFRRHMKAEYSFGPGLTVLRAPNEEGKTTLIEGIGYGLFGSKALRTPIEEVATWPDMAGKQIKPGQVKVQVVFSKGDVNYTVARTKNSAELNGTDGSSVTGQGPVTEACEKLLSVPHGKAYALLIAEQNNVRGALSQGKAAVVKLIEELANFDEVDNLIDLIQEKLPTGNAKILEDRLENLAISQAEIETFVAPETALLESGIKMLEEEIGAKSTKFDIEILEQKRLTKEARDIQEKLFQNDRYVTRCSAMTDRLQGLSKELKDLKAAPDVNCTEDDVQELVEQGNDIQTLFRINQQLINYIALGLTYPENNWEGSLEDFGQARVDHGSLRNEITEKVISLRASLRATKAQQVESNVCTECGHDMSGEINQRLTDTIALHETALAKVEAELVEAEADRAIYSKIAECQGWVDDYLQLGFSFVKISTDVVPFKLSWDNTQVTAPFTSERITAMGVEYDNIQSKILRMQRGIENTKLKRSYITTKETVYATVSEDLKTLKKSVLSSEKVQKLEAEHSELIFKKSMVDKAVPELKQEIERKHNKKAETSTTLALAKASITQHDKDVEDNATAQAEAKEQMADLDFNNTLLKNIRKARPIITDRLWNIVLQSVSNYFTAMRGVTTEVTKESSGFKANGKSIESLSGSALDVLGLSVRLALTHTFLPDAPFMLLDEASAGCDDDRTSSVTGFLKTAGFEQVILVTHKDVDESAADKLILL